MKKFQIVLFINLLLLNTSCNKQNSILPIKSTTANIRVYFTPPKHVCGNLIVNEINSAKKSIYMQAYGLTHANIIKSLINAKDRGVEVKILLDKSNLTQHNSKLDQIISAGIEVLIDQVYGIAHNKIIIIDNKKVITGSFNFTTSADTRNVENVVFIYDSNIAIQYLNNWLNRRSNSQAYCK